MNQHMKNIPPTQHRYEGSCVSFFRNRQNNPITLEICAANVVGFECAPLWLFHKLSTAQSFFQWEISNPGPHGLLTAGIYAPKSNSVAKRSVSWQPCQKHRRAPRQLFLPCGSPG